MRRSCVAAAFSLAFLLAGCASVHNLPANSPLTAATPAELEAAIATGSEDPAYLDDMLVALAFSGGGTRAAAFSFGVLTELDRIQVPRARGPAPLTERIDFISGVSGGSVTAAYFGVKKRAALADFRERFLHRDAEESLVTTMSAGTLARGLSGGMNVSNFPKWLDENLFDGARFGQLRADRRPRIWVNASDIYNRTPFVFGRTAFSLLCSDLDSYKIAEAVAASAAVPIVFAPIVIENYSDKCRAPLPAWAERARRDPNASPMLRSFAQGLERYRDGTVKYVKLLDGGLVDNFGLSGFTIARESSDTPYGPLTPEQAVKLRRVLFLVVDAGQAPAGNWVQTVEGPTGAELIMAAADTAVDAGERASFTAFERTNFDWQQDLIRWRCRLSAAERKRLGAATGWNCRDVKFFVSRVGFDQLGEARAAALDQVPTRFKLPREQVEMVIGAGQDAVRGNQVFRAFVNSL
ncbi:MAG: patatin-like phospholipase family protein [Bradyrhizobiaceae bacterium]|nr:patatin-like phospholipase family protein [Bradyrhizobiaceae bacterium]